MKGCQNSFNMKLDITIVLLLSAFYGGAEAVIVIKPSPQARDVFANNLFLTLLRPVPPESPAQPVVLFSPASLQKFLVAFYNFTCQDHLRMLAEDLCLIDGNFFMQSSVAELIAGPLPVRFRQVTVELITGYIAPSNVLSFFAKDFAELGADILVRNFFIYDGDEIASSFHKSVWEYFNIEVLSRHNAVLRKMGIAASDLQLYNGIKFHAHLDEQFRSVGKFSYGQGRFRFAERLLVGRKRFPCMGLELPLETESSRGLLTLLLLMPGPRMSLKNLEALMLGPDQRNYRDLSKQLSITFVSVRLPNLQFSGKVTMERLMKEMSWLFDAKLPYHGVLNNQTTRIKRFVQRISMRIHAQGGYSQSPFAGPVNPLHFFNTSHTFDCATSPFLFLVRSEDVIYFMGRHDRVSARSGAYHGGI
ncbi:uncharacterized protein LOC6591010 [Drosophila persimilis]|nr:uncharacterized protein LOC6591010 [Drosophila persimilis]